MLDYYMKWGLWISEFVIFLETHPAETSSQKGKYEDHEYMILFLQNPVIWMRAFEWLEFSDRRCEALTLSSLFFSVPSPDFFSSFCFSFFFYDGKNEREGLEEDMETLSLPGYLLHGLKHLILEGVWCVNFRGFFDMR